MTEAREAPPEVLPADEVVTEPEGVAIDAAVVGWTDLHHQAVEEQAEDEAARTAFLHGFDDAVTSVIRPAMEAVVARLHQDGGGGRVVQVEPNELHRPRITLWMSLSGDLASEPRQELNPFLQLDADAVFRRIDVWEGDMVDKQGTSRATTPWKLSEVTTASVSDRIVDILRRASTHGVTVRSD
jgi:hypothetical protein